MADTVQGMRVAVLATEGVEQVELTEPWKALTEAGARPELISVGEGSVQGFHHLDKADTFTVDRTVDAVSVSDYGALLLPGGVANPDALRRSAPAVQLVRDFFAAGRPVAAICHAPWLLIEADVVRDRRLTSFWSLQTDLRNAGARWVDEAVVTDELLVTSRYPDDIPAFTTAMLAAFAAGAASS